MLARFSLAALVAVVVATARPVASGGTHDLLAVGVRVRSAAGETVRLSAPTEQALAIYEELLRTPARPYLPMGQPVLLQRGSGLEGSTVTLLYFGRGSRAGVAPVEFGESRTADSAAAPKTGRRAWQLAKALAEGGSAGTESAALVLLGQGSDAAAGMALEALAQVRPDRAAAAAAGILFPEDAVQARSSVRRLYAVRVLRDRLGGAASFPDLFRRLADDPDDLVRETAARAR